MRFLKSGFHYPTCNYIFFEEEEKKMREKEVVKEEEIYKHKEPLF